jgi:hypothetical protein
MFLKLVICHLQEVGLRNGVADSTYLSAPFDDSGNQGLLVEVAADIIYEKHIERFSEVLKEKSRVARGNFTATFFLISRTVTHPIYIKTRSLLGSHSSTG